MQHENKVQLSIEKDAANHTTVQLTQVIVIQMKVICRMVMKMEHETALECTIEQGTAAKQQPSLPKLVSKPISDGMVPVKLLFDRLSSSANEMQRVVAKLLASAIKGRSISYITKLTK